MIATRRIAELVVVLAAAGCRSAAPAVDPEACGPSTGSPLLTVRGADLAGGYRLTMVSQRGPSIGRVSGGLFLRQQYQDLQALPGGGNTMPAFGTTDIDLDKVGAVTMGELSSADSTKPGVALLEQRTPTSLLIVLRLGSSSNARGVTRFDAGYTALTVRSVSDHGFRGTWSSGVGVGIGAKEASGYFCAERRPPPQ